MTNAWSKNTRETTKNASIARLSRVQNVNSDFVRLRWGDLNLLDFERLAGTPADSGFAFDGLSCGV
jgi:hypothetical protein